MYTRSLALQIPPIIRRIAFPWRRAARPPTAVLVPDAAPRWRAAAKWADLSRYVVFVTMAGVNPAPRPWFPPPRILVF